jgi:hypothetical protein
MVKRGALIGLILAIFGAAAVPAASYAAGTGQRRGQNAAESSKAKQHKQAKKCKNGQVRKNGKCVKKKTGPSSTTPTSTSTPEASATLIVHVYKGGGPPTGEADEGVPLWISQRAADGEPERGFQTTEHTVHVAPGKYEIAALGDLNYGTVAFLASKTVTVGTGQTVELTLEIQ